MYMSVSLCFYIILFPWECAMLRISWIVREAIRVKKGSHGLPPEDRVTPFQRAIVQFADIKIAQYMVYYFSQSCRHLTDILDLSTVSVLEPVHQCPRSEHARHPRISRHDQPRRVCSRIWELDSPGFHRQALTDTDIQTYRSTDNDKEKREGTNNLVTYFYILFRVSYGTASPAISK